MSRRDALVLGVGGNHQVGITTQQPQAMTPMNALNELREIKESLHRLETIMKPL